MTLDPVRCWIRLLFNGQYQKPIWYGRRVGRTTVWQSKISHAVGRAWEIPVCPSIRQCCALP